MTCVDPVAHLIDAPDRREAETILDWKMCPLDWNLNPIAINDDTFVIPYEYLGLEGLDPMGFREMPFLTVNRDMSIQEMSEIIFIVGILFVVHESGIGGEVARARDDPVIPEITQRSDVKQALDLVSRDRLTCTVQQVNISVVLYNSFISEIECSPEPDSERDTSPILVGVQEDVFTWQTRESVGSGCSQDGSASRVDSFADRCR